jgi:hypothetical protein
MKVRMRKAIVAAFLLPLAACSVQEDSPSNAAAVREKLMSVAESPNYYWAWTHAWVDPWEKNGPVKFAVRKCGGFVPKPASEVELSSVYQKYSDGRRAVVNYSDLFAITGTWFPPDYYKANRASLTAAIKKQWQEFGGIMVFSWHMDHPYCTNGFDKGFYNFKSYGDDRNVVKQILDGTGKPCGTGSVDGKRYREPFANPREWYMASLKNIADFFNGLVDDETGKKIPVIMRYAHEMDGKWFWWGRTWCSPDEFREFCRMTADYLRKACGEDQILFAFTPDRTWKEFGREGDSGNSYLAYYPGDGYVDIVGLDDYSIGQGDADKAEKSLVETVRKLRLISAFAKERGKVAALTETGGRNKRDDFWMYLHRAMTADGVKCAFADTWAGRYGTVPDTLASEQDEIAFSRRPEVLLEGAGTGFR